MMLMRIVAAAMANVVVASAACADPFADKVAALTGVETAETQAIDREVTDLIADYHEAYARWLAEPVGPTKGKLMAAADQLQKQALERARAAANLRAETAYQRCLAPDAGGAAVGGDTSPYLCGAVAGAEPGDTPNDPWIVCGCARRYIEGLRAEADAVVQRAPAFVGAIWPIETYWSFNFKYRRSEPLSADTIATYFKLDFVPKPDFAGPIDTIGVAGGAGGWTFLTPARHAQQHIAQLDVFERTTDNPGGSGQVAFADPVQQESALMIPPVRNAYFRVQDAMRWTWLLIQREGALRIAAIEEELVQAVERVEEPFSDQQGAAYSAIDRDEKLTWEQRQAQKREADRKACSGWVASLRPAIDNAVAAARAVTAEVYQARRRLLADAEAWKTFGLKDGAGTGPALASGHDFNDQDFAQFIAESLGLWSLPFGSGLPDNPMNDSKLETGWTLWLPGTVSQEAFGPYCMWPAFFLADPIAAYWRAEPDGPYGYWWGETGEAGDAYDAMVLQAAQARMPEVELMSGHGGVAVLRFSTEAKGQTSEAVVSGAGVGQGP